MISKKAIFFYKLLFIFILLFSFSCEESKSLVLNPNNNVEYDFSVFHLDENNSLTFREDGSLLNSQNIFNSGLSSSLYLGKMNNQDGDSVNSYVYLKVKGELLANSYFCNDDRFYDVNKIKLKLRAKSNLEDLYNGQFLGYDSFLEDCTSQTNEDDCDSYSHCYWYEVIDASSNLIESCETIQSSGFDNELSFTNPIKAYILDSSTYDEDGLVNHIDNDSNGEVDFIESLINSPSKTQIAATINGTDNFITIDLTSHLFQISQGDNSLCSNLDYSSCSSSSECFWSGAHSVDNEYGYRYLMECSSLSGIWPNYPYLPGDSAQSCDWTDCNDPCNDLDCIDCLFDNRCGDCNESDQFCPDCNNWQCAEYECYSWSQGQCINTYDGSGGVCDLASSTCTYDGLTPCSLDTDCNAEPISCQSHECLDCPIQNCNDGPIVMCGNGIVDNLPLDINGNTVPDGTCLATNSIGSTLDNSSPNAWLQDWCSEFSDKDIDILLEYKPNSGNPNQQFIELYSTDRQDYYAGGYRMPYIWFNYDINQESTTFIRKYDIEEINSPFLQCENINSECEWVNGDCQPSQDADPNLDCTLLDKSLFNCGADISCDINGVCLCDSFNNEQQELGTVISFNQNILSGLEECEGLDNIDCGYPTNPQCTYDSNTDECYFSCENFNNDSSQCNNQSYCMYDNVYMSCNQKTFSNIIEASSEDRKLFEYNIDLNSNYLSNIEDITFFISNPTFVFSDEDPENDNWNDCGTDNDCSGAIFSDCGSDGDCSNLSDEWNDCGTDGICGTNDVDNTEGNSIWDVGEGTQYNGQWDVGEETENNSIWDDGEGYENNNQWDHDDLDSDGFTDSNENYELYLDYGIDGCSDEYETGNEYDGSICTDPQFSGNQFGCLCSLDYNAYNPNGKESNNFLDWEDCGSDGDCNNEDNDGSQNNNMWDPGENERWYDWGYDHVDDDFESGCFNLSYPYGQTIVFWEQDDSQPWYYNLYSSADYIEANNLIPGYSYDSLLTEWLSLNSSNTEDNLDIFTKSINTSNGTFDVSICGLAHWTDPGNPYPCQECSKFDPNGDNYNVDPSNDNYNEISNPNGGELDGFWSGNDINFDGVCDVGECEIFFDYGIDGLPDVYENYNYEYEDNWQDCGSDGDCSDLNDEWNDCGTDGVCSTNDVDNTEGNNIWDLGEGTQNNGKWDEGEGTEGNKQWDYKDMNGNQVFDIDYDIYEPFLDYGIDQVTSTFESGSNGAVWNSQGKQNNNSHNSFSNVTYEKFDDFGNDGFPDGDPSDSTSDDYNIDPNEDNYNVLTNSAGTENNNKLDWVDSSSDNDTVWTPYLVCNIDPISGACSNCLDFDNNQECDMSFEGEKWFDWGFDKVENISEDYYLGNEAQLTQSSNSYTLDIDGPDEQLFAKPVISSNDMVTLWISKITRTQQDKYTIEISANANRDIIAFQLQLSHILLSIDETIQAKEDIFLFSHEFNDIDGDKFADYGEPILTENGEKYIYDASMYVLPSYNQNDLRVNSGYGLKSLMNFKDDLGEDIEDFFTNNVNSVVNDEYTNLILYFDNSNVNYELYGDVDLQVEYFDSDLQEFVIYYDNLIENINVNNNSVDSVKIDIAPLIQKYLSNQINYENIVISATNRNNDFSNILINNTDYKPRIEIFYSK